MKSHSVTIAPVDDRCRYWAKICRAEQALPHPTNALRAEDLPGRYLLRGQDELLPGDVLFEGSIGRTDLYKGNHEQLLESIRTKLFILDGDTKVYNGHGNPTTIGFEKDYNPFF